MSQAAMEAMTPLGQSSAPAIVCCAIFFVGGVAAIGNLLYTKYPWYDVLIIACWFRAVSYACKAAYLGGTYRPALAGTSLAFLNAGYGASVAVICLGHAWWYRRKPYRVFSSGVEAALMWSSLLLCVAIIAFGPIVGVVGAGLIFGDYESASAGAAGIRCRIAASYGLLMCNFVIIMLLAVTTIRVLTFRHEGKKSLNSSRKNPKLVVLFLLPAVLLMIRGCTGVTALYESKVFVWENDHYFYLLDTLPEMMAILVLCWPCLLARMACCYPREEEEAREGGSGSSGGKKKAGDRAAELGEATV